MNAFKELEIGIPLGYHEDITGADIRHTVGILVKDKDMWESMSRNGKIFIDVYVERIADVIIKINYVK